MKRKLKLILNGMFYGDSYTKRVFWSIFTVSVLLVGSLIAGAALVSLWGYGLAMVLAVVDAILIHRVELSVATTGEEEPEESAPEEKQDVEEEEKPEPDVDKKKKLEQEQPQISEEEERSPQEKARAGYDAVQNYTERDVKQMFYKYKVKKNHRPVLIDSCLKYRIQQCPAYAWTHRGALHFLLLEEEPRTVTLPLNAVSKMYYEKDVPANQRKEYDCLLGTNLVSMVFGEYRPVYHSVIRGNRQEEVKNLYVIGPDMKFTAASAKELILLLQPEFVLQDSIMESEEYNQYFKQVYKQKVLLDDGVMNIKDYQSRVRGILQKLAEAAITPAAFRMTLTDMVQRGLISNEYATYYSQYNRQYRERNRK